MKGLAITHTGFEDICAKDIAELINCKTEAGNGIVVFKPKELIDLCKLCYLCQSVYKIIYLFDNFKIKNKEDVLENIKEVNINLKEWIGKDTKIRVVCKSATEEFKGNEFMDGVAGIIIEKIKKELKIKTKIDLKNPDLIFYLYTIDDTSYFGIDFAGFDLSKRDYKIFASSGSIKGTFAYLCLREIEICQDEKIVDLYSRDGVMVIEAGLYLLHYPVNYFQKKKFSFLNFEVFNGLDFEKFFEEMDKRLTKDKLEIIGLDSQLGNTINARKNAKIAGIDKSVLFSKISVDWLDVKIKEGEVDKIISRLPEYAHFSDKERQKKYDELFYQAEYIMKKKGIVALITQRPDEVDLSAKKYGFILQSKREAYSGELKLYFLVFEK